MTTRKVGKALVDDETGEVLAVTAEPVLFFKTPYNHDRDAESARVATVNDEPSLTKQEFKDETDINVLLERFMKNNEPPPAPLPEHFMDLTGRTTYFEMHSKMAEAKDAFYQLDPKIRYQYQNDPSKWADDVVRTIENGDLKGLEKMGISLPEKPKEPGTPTGGAPAPVPPAGAPSAPITAPSGAST